MNSYGRARKKTFNHPLYDLVPLMILGYMEGSSYNGQSVSANELRKFITGKFAGEELYFKTISGLGKLGLVKHIRVPIPNRTGGTHAYNLTPLGREFAKNLSLARFCYSLISCESDIMKKLECEVYADHATIKHNTKFSIEQPITILVR